MQPGEGEVSREFSSLIAAIIADWVGFVFKYDHAAANC